MTLRGLLAFVGSILATAAGALSPWVGPFFNFKVISDYFQPELNGVASMFVVIAFIGTYVIWRKGAQRKKKHLMIGGLAGAAALYFVCFILKSTVGVVWAPGAMTTVVVWSLWIVIYLLTFVLLSLGLCRMVMLIPPKEIEQEKSEVA